MAAWCSNCRISSIFFFNLNTQQEYQILRALKRGDSNKKKRNKSGALEKKGG